MVLDFGSKKLLVIASGLAVGSFGAYCSVTRSVIVRAFFLGAFPFSGDVSLELGWLFGISTSYIVDSAPVGKKHETCKG